MDTTLYVFFTINILNIGKQWPTFNNNSYGWWLLGSGSTIPTYNVDGESPTFKYQLVDQYNGPSLYREEIKANIHNYYDNLIKKKMIINYVMADTFNEIYKYKI
jgi:hypothetical protein